MGPKKKGKKAAKKKKAKPEGEEEEEKKEERPEFKVELPEYGWIRLELRLCDSQFNLDKRPYRVVMRTDERILELK